MQKMREKLTKNFKKKKYETVYLFRRRLTKQPKKIGDSNNFSKIYFLFVLITKSSKEEQFECKYDGEEQRRQINIVLLFKLTKRICDNKK